MSDDIVVLRGLLNAANSNVATLAQANRRLTERIATPTTDAAYLAIIDDLEARIAALEAAARDILPVAYFGTKVYDGAETDEYQAAYDALAALLEEGED